MIQSGYGSHYNSEIPGEMVIAKAITSAKLIPSCFSKFSLKKSVLKTFICIENTSIQLVVVKSF